MEFVPCSILVKKVTLQIHLTLAPDEGYKTMHAFEGKESSVISRGFENCYYRVVEMCWYLILNIGKLDKKTRCAGGN